MLKKVLFLLLLTMSFGAGGCSTKSGYEILPGGKHVEPSASFSIGNITDSSGYQFAPDDKDTFDLKEAMQTSLKDALGKQNAWAQTGDYQVNVTILEYKPGHAGLRWLLPGAGATVLSVDATVADHEGNLQARIPVKRSIAAGGAYTIGAWKYVFDEVATEIVNVLLDVKKRKKIKQ